MAGDRQEPPVSSHKAQGAMRAATEAAEPPLLPAACIAAAHILLKQSSIAYTH